MSERRLTWLKSVPGKLSHPEGVAAAKTHGGSCSEGVEEAACCSNRQVRRKKGRALEILGERESREHEEPTTSEMAEETNPPRLSELKAEALKKDRRKKLTLSKFVGGAENTAHPRVAVPELRQEFELGPCRRQMEASLQEIKTSERMIPRAVHLPNCDRKGFYKRKQVPGRCTWPVPGQGSDCVGAVWSWSGARGRCPLAPTEHVPTLAPKALDRAER
nr:insulin-like growth factor-binding protein 5 [Pelodiscus sinensis]|eukprot:XP_025041259.1 insulin-like growth factor-binding protein 5 [Pelodiscus sinensis]